LQLESEKELKGGPLACPHQTPHIHYYLESEKELKGVISVAEGERNFISGIREGIESSE
jgi:hypothetical protein